MAIAIREPFRVRLEKTISLPVLMKEMRSRMRGIRAPILIFVTTGLTIAIGLIILAMQWGEYSYYDNSYRDMSIHMAEMGHTLFIGLMVVEGILCALIAPALTAGAISIEREQQTLELLLLTRLTSANLVLGKLISSLSFVFIVLLCGMPVAAISFLLGGVDPAQFVWALAIILAVVIAFGSFGLYCSSRFAKTTTSVVVSYTACLGWLALVPLSVALLDGFRYNSYSDGFLGVMLMSLGIIFTLALVPATLASILLTLLFRARMPRAVNLGLWGACSAGIVLLLNIPGVIDAIDTEMLLYGNPVVAMAGLFESDQNVFSSIITVSSTTLQELLEALFVPLTVLFQLLASWVAVVLAVGEVQRLRH